LEASVGLCIKGMAMETTNAPEAVNRRRLLQAATAGLGGLITMRQVVAQQPVVPAQAAPAAAAEKPTDFVIACATLPYSRFPLIRALQGIAKAGFHHVAWGVSHLESTGQRVPVLPSEAPVQEAKQLAQRCRDLGLAPVLLFSDVSPEHPDAVNLLGNRILQAAAGGISQVVAVSQNAKLNRPLWLQRLKELAKLAADNEVSLVIKPGAGETGSGRACAELVQQIGSPNVRVNYDAGTVMGSLNIDPIPDLKTCFDAVDSFTIKDHRNVPRREHCGPGLGEIDHYKLLGLVSHTGKTIPLCCDNVYAPLLPPPKTPEEVDELAARARNYLELVTAGLQNRLAQDPR
ncbi:MAG: sugar phosphate isomerase/epimerase, partial [Planctomycetales bacterium]